jgi:hypothetical protein
MDTNTEPRVPDATPRDAEAGATAAPRVPEPHAVLERAMIEAFLAERGYTLRSVDALRPADREPLLRSAVAFATLRLAEIEARAHFVDEID